ncbi:unnamed protein product [Psylliodes chrysocephalus]|uniref:Uncharacterized protein n=1 Tax=Psylliodes chrysocephalus TaxID=3402493 RepID=A0A9P0DF17_9CUCU|nr:unnamed protein product [Psylliodes chrysocephala]
MTVGMFILSQKKRESLAAVFVFLCVLQVIIGCGMTGSSLYVIIAVAPILHAEKSEVNFVFVVTGLYGTHVIFQWIIGINVSQRCLKQASRKSTSNLFILWTTMGTNTIIQLLILSHFARKMNKYISRSIKQSITNGMNQYLQDITWKEVIDKIQYNNECCGLASYEDWHEIKWLTKYHVDVKSETIKEFRTSPDILTLPVIPWSCCKVDFPMQCLHDPVQQAEYAHIWVDEPNIVTDSLNTKGCLDLIRKPIDGTIKAFVVSSSFMCIFHVVIFIVSRILYTSARNSIFMGDPGGISPGWVFGRGDCGYSGGQSIIEIMETHQGYSTDAETTEDETEEPAENKKQKSSKDSKFLEADETKNNLTIPKDESFVLVQNVNEKRSDNKGSQTEGLIKKQIRNRNYQ